MYADPLTVVSGGSSHHYCGVACLETMLKSRICNWTQDTAPFKGCGLVEGHRSPHEFTRDLPDWMLHQFGLKPEDVVALDLRKDPFPA